MASSSSWTKILCQPTINILKACFSRRSSFPPHRLNAARLEARTATNESQKHEVPPRLFFTHHALWCSNSHIQICSSVDNGWPTSTHFLILVMVSYVDVMRRAVKQSDTEATSWTLSEEHVAAGHGVGGSSVALKRASAMFGTGGVGKTTPPAESPSRDFGSTIFKPGAASDLPSWRPVLICLRKYAHEDNMIYTCCNYSNLLWCSHSECILGCFSMTITMDVVRPHISKCCKS